jgi:N-acetylmuramoyl-L-alanine amidase
MIGYHYVILGSGEVQNGRPEFIQGAHARGHNENTIGICLIGDDEPTVLQSVALAKLVKSILERHPITVICGHNELDDNKTCPNFDVQEWVNRMHHCWVDE